MSPYAYLPILNPFFYKVGAVDAGVNAFNDVTDGVNVHCGDDTGFSAAKGERTLCTVTFHANPAHNLT